MLPSRSHLDCLLRSTYKCWMLARSTGVKGAKSRGKPDLRCCFPYANGSSCTFSCVPGEHFAINHEMDRAARRAAKQVILSDPFDYGISHAHIIDDSTHRDGSLYKKRNFGLLELCRITDRNETRLEPMTLSEPTDDCGPDRESCMVHYPSRLMQIFSLQLAQIPIDSNSVEIYGYMAVRDYRDSLLNYIVNRSREDPIIAQQGSLIEMTGPKRGISMCSSVLLEFDMRIKKGEQQEEDLQLIDGVSDFSEIITPCRPFSNRIIGDCGAVDITLALVHRAVEATIEVIISKVHSGFSLSLSSFVFISGLYKGIQLFRGTIGESCGLRRFVVAVKMDTWMHLKFYISQKGSGNDLQRHCSFKANNHGYASQQIIVHLASISARVTWSTVPS